ncbi:MAG: MarC family protein [Candidatus Woesearchaeota archaeon]
MDGFHYALILQIFVLLNPLASVPFLLSAHRQKMNVKIIAIKSVITAFVVAVLFTFIGESLFNVFGISVNALKIAGGIVLLLLALNMVRPKKEENQSIESIDSLITLIATPMLTGPGTISFITIKTIEMGKFTVLFNLLPAFVLVGIVFVIFSFFIHKINPKVIDIASRVLGLFLAAVAIQMIAGGTQGFVTIAIAGV